ncbi:lysostaphin resistance A-like protein [Micromonospora sp. NPDC051141]|uniref:lysostaphin resistance A-like protein n=1 Tax=Micromonospora sp. NPDC051141 TaxID=3364284 RepID=UPI00378FD737
MTVALRVAPGDADTMRDRAAIGYVLVAYTISWGCWLPLAATGRVVRVGGAATHLPGLVGPALAAAAMAVLLRRRDVGVGLGRRVLRWRIGAWWLVAVSPLGMLLAGALVAALRGNPPRLADLALINGFPGWGLAGVLLLLVVVNGFGEETGWRGFLQPRLQRRHAPLTAISLVTVVWVGWHAPLFVVLANYRGFSAGTLVGFAIGIFCGAVVLGWLWNRTGSIPAVAVWHALYNLGAATVAASGTIAAVVTSIVITQAVVLVVAELAGRGGVLTPVPAARDTDDQRTRPGVPIGGPGQAAS